MARNGQFGRLAKSAGFRINPQQHAGTGANRQEKALTENGWGFSIGGARRSAMRRMVPTFTAQGAAIDLRMRRLRSIISA